MKLPPIKAFYLPKYFQKRKAAARQRPLATHELNKLQPQNIYTNVHLTDNRIHLRKQPHASPFAFQKIVLSSQRKY